MPKPSHLSSAGGVAMVDVSAKSATRRIARAEAVLHMSNAAFRAIRTAVLRKGDALVAAQVAGITAAKRTDELIPLAHSLPLSSVRVSFEWKPPNAVRVEAEAKTTAQTGVEMEALVAASVAALTIYDMTKSLDRGIVIERIALLEKSGGKSGKWRRS